MISTPTWSNNFWEISFSYIVVVFSFFSSITDFKNPDIDIDTIESKFYINLLLIESFGLLLEGWANTHFFGTILSLSLISFLSKDWIIASVIESASLFKSSEIISGAASLISVFAVGLVFLVWLVVMFALAFAVGFVFIAKLLSLSLFESFGESSYLLFDTDPDPSFFKEKLSKVFLGSSSCKFFKTSFIGKFGLLDSPSFLLGLLINISDPLSIRN